MPLARFAPSALLQRTLLLVSAGLLVAAHSAAVAQVKQPTVQGTALADSAIPTLISVPTTFSTYFVLNKDLSLVTHSSDNTFVNRNCVAPTGLSASGTAPRTQINDNSAFYVTAQSATASSVSAVAIVPGSTCLFSSPVALAGGIPTQTLTSNDRQHGRYFVLNSFASSPDILTVYNNLNTNSSSTPSLSQLARTSLDSGATYTSIVTDTRSTYGLTAITEAKSSTSPGNLWVYSPGINTAFKILSPTGDPLPATSSFLIPSTNDGGGALLVLVNQDGLTATNQSSPPQVTAPFTIIDLGQLQRSFSAVVASGNTITLPFVTQVPATTSYYAMLGAAYNPVNHLAYALVAGGSSSSSVVQNIISYDVTNPTAPSETVIADVSTIPFTFGTLPRLALNAVSGTMQILSGTALYSVGISGTGNIPVAVTGSVFPDSNFQPTYIAANPLMGETYIASASGQVDILTKPTAAPYAATVTMTGPDNAIANQSYALSVTSSYAFYDTAELAAPLTITATPAGGTPYTFNVDTVGDHVDCSCSITSKTFPAAGVYTLVATVPATANYAAVTSNPVVVTVGATGVTGVYTTALTLSVPSNPTSTSVNATVTLAGSTYAPTGRIVVSDANGEVGRLTLAGGILPRPATIPLTLANGASTLTAVYNGDSQNKTATSNSVTTNVGTAAKVTPTITLKLPSSPTTGATSTGTVSLLSSSTTPPTGNVTVYSVPPNSITPVTLATVPAASAYASGGTTFNFTAPAAGTSSVFASYDGDTAYNQAYSPTYSLVSAAPSTISTTLSISAPSSPTAGVNFTALLTLKSATTGSTAPTGNVTLTATPAGGGTPSSATYTAAQAYASGGYAAQVALTAAGTYTLTAAYAGDANYGASTGSVTVVVTAPPPVTPTISLSVAATATAGTAQIGSISYDFSGSSATATGNILILATSSTGATTTLATIAASQTKGHLITAFGFTAPASGTYAVIARYAGDAAFNPADSNTVSLAVTSPGFTTTAVSLSAPSSVPVGTPFTLSVRLTSTTTPPAAPTGNVIVTATLPNGTPLIVASIPATQAIVTGGTTASSTLLAAGSYTLTATYAGDTNYGTSTASIGITVTLPAPTVTLSSASNALVGTAAAVIVKFNVNVAGDTTTVKGNINVTSSNGTTSGPSATVGATDAYSTVGATASLTFTAPGTYTIMAAYAGDTKNGPATATPITIVVTSPTSGTTSFTMTLDDTTVADSHPLTLATPIASASTTFTLKALGGFNTPLNLSYDPTTLSSAIFVGFKDASGKIVTQVTPSAAGTQITLVVSGVKIAALSNPLPPATRVPAIFSAGLLGMLLLGRRRLSARTRRVARAINALLIVLVACTTLGAYSENCLGNCSSDEDQYVKIIATPANSTQVSTPQSVLVHVHYVQELDSNFKP